MCVEWGILLSIAPKGKIQPRLVVGTLVAVKAGSLGVIKEGSQEERRAKKGKK